MAGTRQVDARAELKVDAHVVAVFEEISHRTVDVERADFEHARAAEVRRILLFDG